MPQSRPVLGPPRKFGDIPAQQEMKDKLHLLLIEKINSITDWQKISDADQNSFIKQFIEKRIEQDYSATPLSSMEKDQIIQEIRQEIKGFGPLDSLLHDPSISDILVNGPKQVYVEIGGKLKKTNIVFKDNAHLLNIIERIVSKVGRRIDEKSPMVDARLPDGSRVNAVIPPLAIDGASLSIRRFKADAATIHNLLTWGSMTVSMAETLKAAVKAHLNIVISGGTGAGKTTLLNSLSSQIPEDERIVTIEDSAELSLQQEHVVRLETRPANIEGTGAITARDLLINSLRMRPDRVVIGECRGAEAFDMLQAMNTGHDGSLTTLHANTPRDACTRLETMCMYTGIDLPEKTIRQQISSAVHLIIQASRLSDGSRRVTYISEITGMEGNIITMQDIFKWEQYGLDENGRVIGCHVSTGVRPKFSDKCKAKGIKLPTEIFDANAPAIYLCKNPPNEKMPNKPKSSSSVDEPESLDDIIKQRKAQRLK
jgi:pilus assembly protein CpaF